MTKFFLTWSGAMRFIKGLPARGYTGDMYKCPCGYKVSYNCEPTIYDDTYLPPSPAHPQNDPATRTKK